MVGDVLAKLVLDKEGNFSDPMTGEVMDAMILGQPLEVRETLDFIVKCEGWYDPMIRIMPEHAKGADAYCIMGQKTEKIPLSRRDFSDVLCYRIALLQIMPPATDQDYIQEAA